MDFFEVLKKRAWDKFTVELDDPKLSEPSEVLHPIDATIEALKEMMVGEPTEAMIQHTRWVGGGITYIRSNDDDFAVLDFDGFCGTDGEEVAVMVFKKP